jgi:aminoglycoside phosphotransferase (APT) family kinase protein
MDELLSHCTTHKNLIHSNFGFHSSISDGQATTGVFDWADSHLGDFLYDVATLDSSGEGISYGDLGASMPRLAKKYRTVQSACAATCSTRNWVV